MICKVSFFVGRIERRGINIPQVVTDTARSRNIKYLTNRAVQNRLSGCELWFQILVDTSAIPIDPSLYDLCRDTRDDYIRFVKFFGDYASPSDNTVV